MSNNTHKKINVGIVGVGNCASALVQGVHFYSAHPRGEKIPGLMYPIIDDIAVEDINFVSAFDVDSRKVGSALSEAIFEYPNCVKSFCDTFNPAVGDPYVKRAPMIDGVAQHMITDDPLDEERFYVPGDIKDYHLQFEYEREVNRFAEELQKTNTEVLLNYLPVGSRQATEFWADVCILAGVSMVNCIPEFIASEPVWAKKFIDAKIPMIGDDMRSQFGASILSAVLQELLHARGIEIGMHYQDNIGGNTDFHNMQDQSRLKSKKISKENVIHKQNELVGVEAKENSVHAGPANYFPDLKDNKRAHWLIRGEGFGGATIEFTADLSVQDSPNSAGVVIDAIRYVIAAKRLGIVGPLVGPSAWTQKTPPKDMRPNDAAEECASLSKGSMPKDYVKISDKENVYVHQIFSE